MTIFPRTLELFFAPAIAFTLALALVACETPVQRQTLPQVTFAHLGAISLNVARIEVVSDYKPTMASPHVDHLFPTPPLTALRSWANDRLRAVGRSGTARFVIRDAAAREAALPQKKGFVATFTKQQAKRYDLAVDAVLLIVDGPSRGQAEARASRFITVGEDISVNDRDKTWFDLTEKMMADFDGEMTKNIGQHLGHWLK